MADDPGQTPASSGAEGPGRAPPPLSAIRIRPPGARGLNRKAIIAVASCALLAVLVIASNSLAASGAKKPAETKPMMSDPSRPETARNSVAALPASYDKVMPAQANALPPDTPLLGPPLPGDVAAFAPQPQPPKGPAQTSELAGAPQPPQPQSGSPPPVQSEAAQAQRSGLFFAVHETPKDAGAQQRAVVRRPLEVLGQPQLLEVAAADKERVLFPGAVIPASMVTSIDSEAPGPAIAQVTQAIYDSIAGRTLLIPQGSRLIGDYKSAARFGQGRIAIAWSRLILPDGTEIALDLPGLDPSGAAGAPGRIDAHWGDVFGAAALGTLIGVGVAATEQQPALGVGGLGVITGEDPAEAAIRQGVTRTASAVTARVVDRSLSVAPTIRVKAGTRITVIATRRMAF